MQKWQESELKFIEENWQKMNDSKISCCLGYSPIEIRTKRRQLGLKRKKGPKKNIAQRINPNWLKQALEEKGLILDDVGKKYGVSKERIRQVCKEFQFEIKRTPQWYANRYGLPNLGNKEWLSQQLKETSGATGLSRRIDISVHKIRAQAKRLGINRSSTIKHAETVRLTCSFCGKTIERKKCLVRPGQKFFFCNKGCQGKWVGSWLAKKQGAPF